MDKLQLNIETAQGPRGGIITACPSSLVHYCVMSYETEIDMMTASLLVQAKIDRIRILDKNPDCFMVLISGISIC